MTQDDDTAMIDHGKTMKKTQDDDTVRVMIDRNDDEDDAGRRHAMIDRNDEEDDAG